MSKENLLLVTLLEQKKEYQQSYQNHLNNLRNLRSNLGLSEQFTISRLDDAYDLLVELLKLTKMKDRKASELQQLLHDENMRVYYRFTKRDRKGTTFLINNMI